jgi:glucuronoarabinoxylan endo-1,4-beta-xylanase
MIQKLKYSFYTVVLLYVINTPVKIFASNGTIKASENHQRMVGFGASIAWYEGMLTSHPQKEDIYFNLFDDLGLDILRIRNVYRNDPNFGADFAEIVSKMRDYAPDSTKILVTSWSPPANLKSNGSTDNGGTLIKENGAYAYGAFAKYWVDAINAYRDIGIDPDYITIQNEVDFTATWESCVFDPTENATNAGYNRALDSVYYAIQQLESPPKILGPEVLGIGYSEFQKYGAYFNKAHLDGYAYHLYHGASDNSGDNHNPDLFNTNLSSIANTYKGKPIFQTEYDVGDWFTTAWLMHDCIVNGNVSAYLWWELVWGSGGKPLIEMGSSDYTITKYYWAFRQYSKFISSGWNRVTATDDADSLRISAFINPDGNKLTVVVINIGSQTQSMSFDIQDFSVDNGKVIRTSETESGSAISNSYDGKSAMDFPTRSITTLSFSGALVTNVDNKPLTPIEFSLSQNYPNPFNPSTTIDYSLAKESFVQLKIFDVLGREIRTLVKERIATGKYTIQFDATNLNSGIYFYQITAGDFIQSKKMILVK